MRAPFQVLIVLYRMAGDGCIEYCIFRRSDSDLPLWQWISGGGVVGENARDAAVRETEEESGVQATEAIFRLQSMTMIPAEQVCGLLWGEELLVIPEYAFAADVSGSDSIRLSSEHLEFRWVAYREAVSLLRWDSNKTALFELDYRLRHSRPLGPRR